MTITHIQLHPIKALDAVRVDAAHVLPTGALALDRRFALTDARGRFLNGKNRSEIHSIRADYDLAAMEVSLDGTPFSLDRQGPSIASWFSDRFHEPITWNDNPEVGHPDDLDSPGPTFISTATLRQVAAWFELDLDEARRRFRTNIEFEAPEPFWEDRLYGTHFQAGNVAVYAVNPCQRCVVPSRDSHTGAQDPRFQKSFAQLREASLPAYAPRAPFNHYYRLAVNTRIAPEHADKLLRIGDAITAS